MHALPVADPVEWAFWTLRLAGLEGLARPNPCVAAAALGLRLIAVLASALPVGEFEEIRGKEIRYRSGLPARTRMRVIAHAIAHYVAILNDLFTGDDVEAWCDAFADAMLFPRQTALMLSRLADDGEQE